MKKPRISLKQLLGIFVVASIVAWWGSRYESWYGVRWTQADSKLLTTELAEINGEITERMAIRVAIDAAVSRGKSLRILPNGVERGVWTHYSEDGEPIEPVEVECYIVHLEDIPSGPSGAFTRILGGHCTVFVGLDGSVLYFGRGA
ncbi:hypothetical protein Pla123a_39740 [Posidoniimonas polymericola]|uniref:Uncharacterized protein n=1 Tax=Posidoniimonas polymericola TaxID=2528002 RepID=A0A5C5YCM0_9BACT|nr:hypothetical protein [Posidoniimonas polymericola]TWT72678.1 hypothetical protein Pla123a_39740 [Posidoniimonas polymericola]